MTNVQKLVFLKSLHTLIWVFYNIVIAYLVYAVLVNVIDKWVWISLGLIALEGLILLIFGNICPVTVLARRYSNSTKENFDIYLPNWLAKYNKLIYTIIVVFIIVLLVYRIL